MNEWKRIRIRRVIAIKNEILTTYCIESHCSELVSLSAVSRKEVFSNVCTYNSATDKQVIRRFNRTVIEQIMKL